MSDVDLEFRHWSDAEIQVAWHRFHAIEQGMAADRQHVEEEMKRREIVPLSEEEYQLRFRTLKPNAKGTK